MATAFGNNYNKNKVSKKSNEKYIYVCTIQNGRKIAMFSNDSTFVEACPSSNLSSITTNIVFH